MMSSEKDYVKIGFIQKSFLIRKTDLKNIIGCSIVILNNKKDKVLIAKCGKTKKEYSEY